MVEIEYGHFPYTIARERILPLIEEFENESLGREARRRKDQLSKA
jgi:hypothetical protein